MIPFNKPCRLGTEFDYLAQVAQEGKLSHGGTFTAKVEQHLGGYYNAKVFLTSSCTHALELSALALKSLNDTRKKVVVPSFAYVSTANAFALHGFEIVFADIDKRGNLSPDSLQTLDLSEVLAVVVLHYAGMAADIMAIKELLSGKGVYLIEDNAIGIGATYKNQKLGTFGDLSTLSFHETKVVTCGEGGSLIVNNNKFEQAIEIARNKGTNRKDFDDGRVDKYNWVGLGSAYLPSEFQAAWLLAQLNQLDEVIRWRKILWTAYFNALKDLTNQFTLPEIDSESEHNASVFYLLLPNVVERDRLIAYLKENNVMAVFHYQALHGSPYITGLAETRYSCPMALTFSERIVRLPLFYNMTLSEIALVTTSIRNFYN